MYSFQALQAEQMLDMTGSLLDERSADALHKVCRHVAQSVQICCTKCADTLHKLCNSITPCVPKPNYSHSMVEGGLEEIS